MHPLSKAVCGFFAVPFLSVPLLAATPTVAKKPAAANAAELAFEEHKVKKGETLWGIAQKHSTSVGEIMDCNRLPNETVRDGMTLKIPLRKKNIPIKINAQREAEDIKEVAAPAKPAAQAPLPAGATIHTVTENDTFYSIGKKYGLSMESVVAANPAIKPEQLREGMKVVIPKTSPAKSKDSVVKTGDDKVKVSATKTTALTTGGNSPAKSGSDKAKTPLPTSIAAKDVNKEIPASKAVVAPSKPTMTAPAEIQPKTMADDGIIRSYIVSAGEDENTISEAFGITKKQLLDYNRLSSSTNLKPGDEIMIPRVAR